MLSQGRATSWISDMRRCCACWGAGEQSAFGFSVVEFCLYCSGEAATKMLQDGQILRHK